eukprot:6179644-Pleurochrysis_carterae.AAC.1
MKTAHPTRWYSTRERDVCDLISLLVYFSRGGDLLSAADLLAACNVLLATRLDGGDGVGGQLVEPQVNEGETVVALHRLLRKRARSRGLDGLSSQSKRI